MQVMSPREALSWSGFFFSQAHVHATIIKGQKDNMNTEEDQGTEGEAKEYGRQ